MELLLLLFIIMFVVIAVLNTSHVKIIAMVVLTFIISLFIGGKQ